MLAEELVYQVEGKYWDVEQACYVDEPTAGKTVVQLYASGKPAKEDYLQRTLKFYGFPMGQFAEEEETTEKSTEERLAALEQAVAPLKEAIASLKSRLAVFE